MARLQRSRQSESSSVPSAGTKKRIIQRRPRQEPEPARSEPEPEPLLYDLATASKMLSVSRGMVYRLINTKEIHAVKIGGRTLISADELKRYVGSLSS